MGKKKTSIPTIKKSKIPNKKQSENHKINPFLLVTDDLLDKMGNGNEFASIIRYTTPQNHDGLSEIRKLLKKLEAIRNRPAICYVSNIVKIEGSGTNGSIAPDDDLPFSEMVNCIDESQKSVDVFLITPGGDLSQTRRFVNHLRPRFDEVDFIIPWLAMSAGTVFSLSGDRIWMSKKAVLGPIDPQVPDVNGRPIPVQAVFVLLNWLNEIGEEARKNGKPLPISHAHLLRNIDPRIIGDALSISRYSIEMASEFLYKYKFKKWEKRNSTGEIVTDEFKRATALDIAKKLCDHSLWHSHSTGIDRYKLNEELGIKIDFIENDKEFSNIVDKMNALFQWIFSRNPKIGKIHVSENYGVVYNRT